MGIIVWIIVAYALGKALGNSANGASNSAKSNAYHKDMDKVNAKYDPCRRPTRMKLSDAEWNRYKSEVNQVNRKHGRTEWE